MATGWQHEILTRLQARDVQDKAYAEIVENCEQVLQMVHAYLMLDV